MSNSEPHSIPYHEMTEVQLRESLAYWGAKVNSASGFASAHFAAKQCEAITACAKRKGLLLENKWPIMRE